MNRPDPPHLTINSCFSASRSVWVHLAMFHYYTKLNAKRVEQVQLMHKFGPWSCFGNFSNECTRPNHWTLNSCLCASRCVWVHLAIFRYYMKLSAKWVELVKLMHKFVPWSRFGIFRNECTRPTPLDPKLMYCYVSQCLGAFWIVSLLHEAWCKTGWTSAINAKVLATKSHQNFSQQTHPIHPIGP